MCCLYLKSVFAAYLIFMPVFLVTWGQQKQAVHTPLTYYHLTSYSQLVSEQLLIYTPSRQAATLILICSHVPVHVMNVNIVCTLCFGLHQLLRELRGCLANKCFSVSQLLTLSFCCLMLYRKCTVGFSCLLHLKMTLMRVVTLDQYRESWGKPNH